MPSSLRLSCAVWPYESGEVIVQAYNTLLSIEKLLETCDGLLLLRNEELHATCAVRPQGQQSMSLVTPAYSDTAVYWRVTSGDTKGGRSSDAGRA